jgi:F-type H+-transporting ATPase subunit delta
MADRHTIARPYAKAAFKEAADAAGRERWAAMLARGAACVTDARVKGLIGSPKCTPAQMAELVTGIATSDKADEPTRNFLHLLADNRRLGFLPEISRLFQSLKDEVEGAIDLHITSAAPMSAEQQQQLSQSLEKRFNRKVRVATSVDAALIGGAVVRAGDTVIDGSLKSRLERLAYELTA